MLFLLIAAILILPTILKKNDIYLKSLSYQFPGSISVKQFELDKPNFKLKIEQLELDLDFTSLLKGKFIGNGLRANGVNIFVQPTDSPFSYNSIPYLKFEEVDFKNASLLVLSGVDSIYMEYPDLKVDGLLWNDSIQINTLTYKNGLYYSSKHSPEQVTDSAQNSAIKVPSGVPLFKVNRLELIDNKVVIKNTKNVNTVKAINLTLHGWNNPSGSDLELQHLECVLQDSLEIKLRSDQLEVNNLKGAGVHHLKLELAGVQLNLNELSVKDFDSGKRIYCKIESSRISPSLVKLFTKNASIFKNDAADFRMEGSIEYAHDSLMIETFSISTLSHTNLHIKGNIARLGKENNMNIQIDPICISGQELSRIFNFAIPESFKNIQACNRILLKGKPDELELIGHFNINRTNFSLNAGLIKSRKNNWFVDFIIQSKEIQLADLLQKQDNAVKIYSASLKSRINLNNISGLSILHAELTCDSIRNNTLILKEPLVHASVTKKEYSLLIESKKQFWKLSLNGSIEENNFNSSEIIGSLVINDLGFVNQQFSHHAFSTQFKAFYKLGQDSITALAKFNQTKITSNENKTSELKNTKIEFFKWINDYQVDIQSENKTVLNTKFDAGLFQWFSHPSRRLDSIPNFYFKSSIQIDSGFTEALFGQKIQADLELVEIEAKRGQLKSNINIPYLSAFETKLIGLKSESLIENNESYSHFELFKVNNPMIQIDSIYSHINETTIDSFVYTFQAKLPSINQEVSFAGGIVDKKNKLLFYYDNNNILQFGEQQWVNMKGNKVEFDLGSKAFEGELNLSNEDQKINFESHDGNLSLVLEKFKLGAFAKLFFKEPIVHAELNLSTRYSITSNSLNIDGVLKNMDVDSVDLGLCQFNGFYSPNKSHFEVHSESSSWMVEARGSKEGNKSEAELKLNKLNLNKLDSVLTIFSQDYKLAGNITGFLKYNSSNEKPMSGELDFNRVHLHSNLLGTGAKIHNQQIKLTDERIVFSKFEILDETDQHLDLNGFIDFSNNGNVNLSVVTNSFYILNNNDIDSRIQGKLQISSDLKMRGSLNDLEVSGNLSTLKGGNIFYYNKKNVSLQNNQEIVNFISFSEQDKKPKIKLKRNKERPINWNVDLNIGHTDVFVLLSKSTQEFAKFKATGDLKLKKGKGNEPELFGDILSKEGKVFYNLPFVSKVDLDLKLAKASWKGDVRDPIINFKGVETFRVTPNDMSSEFSDKTNKVPVYVSIGISDKSVKNLEMDFDISSGNADVQNMLTALPADTKESYALSMLVHGRVNNESKNITSVMEPIVKKMNEISRRNIKNADLSFHVDNTGNQNTDGSVNPDKIGYNFSKALYNEKLKVSVGGNFDVGPTTEASKSSPLGTIQLEYQLKEEPNMTIQLKRENSYRGPIEGQVDESSIILNFNKKFDNIFLLKPASKKDSLHQNKN